MRCNNCGQENKEYARFCEQCGAPLPSGDMIEANSQTQTGYSGNGAASMTAKSRRNRILVCAGALVLVAACIVGAMLYFNSQKQTEYQGKLQSADKYLQALDYEKAEAAFLEAIKMEPKKEDAYMKLADIYTEQGKFSQAEQILKTGKQKVSGTSGKEKLAKRTSEQAELNKQYTSFYNLCREYQTQYGTAGYELEYDGADTFHMTGLCVARLYDFNRDDRKELILVYPGENEWGGDDYLGEVWAWQDGKLENVLKKTALAHDQDLGKWLEVTADDKNSYFALKRGEWYTKYFQYDGTAFESVFHFEQTLDEVTGDLISLINGKKVAEEEVMAEYEKFPSQNLDVDPYGGNLEYEPGGMAFRVDLQVLPETYAKALAEDTNSTVERMAPKSDDTGKQDKSQYQAYYDLCMEYQEKYGTGAYQAVNESKEIFASGMTGLCVIKLVDFDKDGREELLLGYANKKTEENIGEYQEYFNEVWAWNGKETVQVLPKTPVCEDQDGCEWIEVAEKDDEKYLLTILYGGEFFQYRKYENGKFVSKYEYEMIFPESGSDFTYRVNDKTFSSYEEAELEMNNFPDRIEEDPCSEKPGIYQSNDDKFRIYLRNISQSYGEALDKSNQQVLKELQSAN